MTPDVLSLYRFYQSPLGVAAGEAISKRLHLMWPRIDGDMVGLGYGPPFLDGFAADGVLCHAMMPAHQGVMAWPRGVPACTALVDDDCLPLSDNTVSRVIVAHALEHAENPERLLREVWRVLKPGGRVAVIVPNRRRIWSSMEHTPFGHGNPYSASQLERLLGDKFLSPIRSEWALVLPPTESFGLTKLMKPAEWIARGYLRRVGGVLIIEAEKQVYGAIPSGKSKKSVVPIIAEG